MPLYEYEPEGASCPYCRGGFEALQSFSDPPLTACPECQRPCRRIISAPHHRMSRGDLLSPGNLAAKGFTQYRRVKKGEYKKTAGRGPDTIKR